MSANGDDWIKDDWTKFENIKFLAPAFGTSVAIVFDVGYFAGIDLSFFTLFSLSEHVLFALPALPVVVTVVVLFYSYVGILVSWTSRRLEGGSRVKVWGFHVIMLGIVLGMAIFKANEAAIFFAVLTLFIFAADQTRDWKHRWHLVFMTAVVGILVLAFACGYMYTNFQPIGRGSPHMLRGKDGATTRGLLIVAGERGVLFSEADSRVIQFRRWDGIERIERTAQ